MDADEPDDRTGAAGFAPSAWLERAAGLGASAVVPLDLGSVGVPPPDPSAEPEGFVVDLEPDRIHFLDWGEPVAERGEPARPGILFVHGLAGTAWTWAPVARRLAAVARVVAVDLRGHGLSDAPTDGYDEVRLPGDLEAVLDGTGLLTDERPLVIAGHGFGAAVAAWSARRLGPRCSGLLLVDGGLVDLAAATGMTPDEWLRGLEEPPEVMRSIDAYLADRAGFDPATWDADQERAARAAVVEVPAGHVVPVVRPHVLARSVEAMFAYRPSEVIAAVAAPVVALLAAGDELAGPGLVAVATARADAGRSPLAVVDLGPARHNLPRYRPDAVARATLALAAGRMGR